MRIVRTSAVILFGGYVGGLLLLALLRVVIGDAWWWLALAYNAVPYYFLPLLLLLPLALALRWRHVFIWCGLLALIGGLWCAPLFVPPGGAAAGGRPFSLITFNLYPFNAQLAAAQTWLLGRNADVILLQEVPDDATGALADLLAAYPYQAVDGAYWALARFPVVDHQPFVLADKAQQRLTLDINNQLVALYNIHLAMPIGEQPHLNLPLLPAWLMRYDEQQRNAQIKRLLDEVRPALLARTPFIVAGDFNLSEFSPIYDTLRAAWGDAFRATNIGIGATFPGGASEELPDVLPPLVRLDYAFYGGGLRPVYSEIGPRLGSDHLPLVVIFELPSASAAPNR